MGNMFISANISIRVRATVNEKKRFLPYKAEVLN